MPEGLKIVALCVAAAVAYGVVHDQITARLCIEYFTVGHKRLWPTDSPTMHGLIWGFVATWWAGAFLGVLLAVAARFGPGRKRSWKELSRPVRNVLAAMALSAATVGALTALAVVPGFTYAGPWSFEIPKEAHCWFFVCARTHEASYAGAAVFGLTLVLWTARSRWKVVDREAWRASAAGRGA